MLTRRVERLVEQLGVASLSRWQVSEMATYLDAQVVAFRNRPLDSGPYVFVWVDALTIKASEAGRTAQTGTGCLVVSFRSPARTDSHALFRRWRAAGSLPAPSPGRAGPGGRR